TIFRSCSFFSVLSFFCFFVLCASNSGSFRASSSGFPGPRTRLQPKASDSMLREILKSKIHRATVTDANLSYEGSITIDPELMALSDIEEYEKVQVVDLNNGERFETYCIRGQNPGSGEICVNGAASRLV